MLHEEKQDLPAQAVTVNRELEEADRVIEQRIRIKRASKRMLIPRIVSVLNPPDLETSIWRHFFQSLPTKSKHHHPGRQSNPSIESN